MPKETNFINPPLRPPSPDTSRATVKRQEGSESCAPKIASGEGAVPKNKQRLRGHHRLSFHRRDAAYEENVPEQQCRHRTIGRH